MSGLQIVGPMNRKVIVPRELVAEFNRTWPGSELRASRSYWFEFDTDGNFTRGVEHA